jgi:hypothetical protein
VYLVKAKYNIGFVFADHQVFREKIDRISRLIAILLGGVNDNCMYET